MKSCGFGLLDVELKLVNLLVDLDLGVQDLLFDQVKSVPWQLDLGVCNSPHVLQHLNLAQDLFDLLVFNLGHGVVLVEAILERNHDRRDFLPEFVSELEQLEVPLRIRIDNQLVFNC